MAATEPTVLPGEALEPCEADSYLLVGDEIPPLVVNVVLQRRSVLAHPLARWHREAAEEIRQLEDAWRSRGKASLYEVLYGLGLALAVAGAVELGNKVETGEAEVALSTTVTAVKHVFIAELATAILYFFRELGELAPHYYVQLVSAASELRELERGAAREMAVLLEEVVEKHWKELKVRGWPPVEAVRAYSDLLTTHRMHFSEEEMERLRERMCKLLEELEGQLRDIAEVYALMPALEEGMKPCSGADPAGRAEELLKRLREREREEPSGQAAEWAAARAFKPEFKLLVKEQRGTLTYSLARYKMKNDDLEAARKLFTVSAEIARELEDWGNYLASRSLAVRCNVLGAGSLEELRRRVGAFEDLWSEAKEHRTLEIGYLVNEFAALAGYLVSLALEGRVDEGSELLEREGLLLELLPDWDVAVRLLLELLEVGVGKPEAREVATALRNHIPTELRPIFIDALSGAMRGDREAAFLQVFREWLGKRVDKLLWGEGSEERKVVKRFRRELIDFVDKRGASAVVQLLAPATSLAHFTLMLWALLNGDEELARAHAKLASIIYEERLFRRLFREAAEARSEEEFKLALLKLFYLHI
jgi:hypothetical protein